MSWEEVRVHPFWEDEPLGEYVLPPQPQFDAFVAGKGIDPQRFYEQRSKQVAERIKHTKKLKG